MTQMTDETRDEIVRLVRKGWPVSEIKLWLVSQVTGVTEEQVQAVVDEADREVERMLTPSVPRTNRDDGREEWSVHVPATNDAIGRIAKWLDDAREVGYGSRDIAEMLSEAVGELTDRAHDHMSIGTDAEGLADQLDAMAERTSRKHDVAQWDCKNAED